MYLISDGGINTNTLDTIESIMLTKNVSKIDGVKLDVRISLDKIFVVSRYEELEKFTYAKGNLSEYKYSYLRKVKFPSHIFKYYIPTLEEILKDYNKEKIIVLEIYDVENLDKLFNLLVKYHYHYYFLCKEVNELKKHHFDKLGNIISYQEIEMNSNNTFYIKENSTN